MTRLCAIALIAACAGSRAPAAPDAALPSCSAPPPTLPAGTCGDYLCIGADDQTEERSWCGPLVGGEPPRALVTPR